MKTNAACTVTFQFNNIANHHYLLLRRGHGNIVKLLLAIPVVKEEIARFEVALVEKHAELEAAQKDRERAAEEERLRLEEEERLRQEEERKRKEFEKAQRKFRDKMTKYDGQVRAYKKEIAEKEFFSYEFGAEEALKLIASR